MSEEGLPEVLDVIVDVESSTYQLNELPGVSDLPTLVDVTNYLIVLLECSGFQQVLPLHLKSLCPVLLTPIC